MPALYLFEWEYRTNNHYLSLDITNANSIQYLYAWLDRHPYIRVLWFSLYRKGKRYQIFVRISCQTSQCLFSGNKKVFCEIL